MHKRGNAGEKKEKAVDFTLIACYDADIWIEARVR